MKAIDEFKVLQSRLFQTVGIQPESRFLEIPSVSGQVHVLSYGEGPSVVMVPGFGDPAAMWSPLIARLQGFRVFAVDRPCFGLTGPATHTKTNLRSLATNFLEQVLDALSIRQALIVANSVGSLWSIWLALDRPSRVSAMTHIGCPALLLGSSAPLPMRLLSVPAIGWLLMKLLPPSPKQVDSFAEMAGADLSQIPELRDLLVGMQKLPGVPASLRQLLHAVIRLRGARPGLAITETQLQSIKQPVQFLWGERDPFGAPELGKRAAELVPRSEFHLISGGGHVPWVDHVDRVAQFAGPFLRTMAASASQADHPS